MAPFGGWVSHTLPASCLGVFLLFWFASCLPMKARVLPPFLLGFPHSGCAYFLGGSWGGGWFVVGLVAGRPPLFFLLLGVLACLCGRVGVGRFVSHARFAGAPRGVFVLCLQPGNRVAGWGRLGGWGVSFFPLLRGFPAPPLFLAVIFLVNTAFFVKGNSDVS